MKFKPLALALFTLLALAPWEFPTAIAGTKVGSRTFNSPCPVRRRLATQFSGNIFLTADPSPAGTPKTRTSSTGISGLSGSVTVVLQAGFTAPVTLTAYIWNQDDVDSTKSCWVRCAPGATGSDVYSKAIDTNYATVQFSVPEVTPFLIISSGAITGNVYVDCDQDPSNTSSTATGY